MRESHAALLTVEEGVDKIITATTRSSKGLLYKCIIPVPGTGEMCSSEISAEVGEETGGCTASFEGVVPTVGMAITYNYV